MSPILDHIGGVISICDSENITLFWVSVEGPKYGYFGVFDPLGRGPGTPQIPHLNVVLWEGTPFERGSVGEHPI